MEDNTPRDLANLVLAKIAALGDTEASKYFEMSMATILAWRTRKTPPSLAAAQRVWDDTLTCHAPEIWGGNGKESVCLAMPMYENVEPLTMVTLIRCMKLYGMDKIRIIPEMRTLIDEARNTLVQRFMATDSEYCLFLDADMILPCGAGAMLRQHGFTVPEPKASVNAIERIMSHPKEARIVGALYRNRRGTGKPALELAYRSAQEDERLRGFFDGKTKGEGLEETGWVGFGMVRIHRSVFKEMQDAAVEGGPLAEIAPPKGREKDAFGYFGRTPQWRGEDISYCRRAQKIGIKTYVDTGLLLGHMGKRIM